jgi:Chalcone isomerase-like
MQRKFFLGLSTVLAAAILGLGAGSASAQTTVGGIKFDPEVTVGGQKLQLNGAGLRIRVVFRVYAAALYTPSKAAKNEDVLKPGLKRLQMVALRDVKGDEFGKLFTRAMEDNASRDEFSKSINSVIRMGQIFADAKQFAKGDVIILDFVPNTGLVVTHKGKPLGDAFKEAEFQSLMLKIWFGPKPVDNELRKALLGEQSTANTNVN